MIGSPSGCSRPSLRTTPLLMRALPEHARVGVFLSTVHYLCFFSLFFFFCELSVYVSNQMAASAVNMEPCIM